MKRNRSEDADAEEVGWSSDEKDNLWDKGRCRSEEVSIYLAQPKMAAECDEVVIAVAESLSTPSKSSVVRLQSKLSKFSSGGSKTGGWMKSCYKRQVRIAEVAIMHIDKIGTRYPCSIEQWRECNALGQANLSGTRQCSESRWADGLVTSAMAMMIGNQSRISTNLSNLPNLIHHMIWLQESLSQCHLQEAIYHFFHDIEDHMAVHPLEWQPCKCCTIAKTIVHKGVPSRPLHPTPW